MGLIAKVLSFFRAPINGVESSEVKVNPGGGANISGPHFSDPGDDAFPLDTDYAVAVETPASGSVAVVAYADPINAPTATAGEKRIYGRDPATGQAVNEVHLQSDGSVVISNTNGFIQLNVDGSVTINGATITVLGDVITALGRSLDTHVHSGVTSGGGTSGPPV